MKKTDFKLDHLNQDEMEGKKQKQQKHAWLVKELDFTFLWIQQ